MKRDFELVRALLLYVEQSPPGKSINDLTQEDYETEVISEHMALLIEEGFLKGKVSPSYRPWNEGKKVSGKTLSTVNIKIRKDQKEWLTDTASTVRNNNSDPVPPSERVYPQHLIGVASNFLEATGVE